MPRFRAKSMHLLAGNPFSAVHCAVYQGSAHCLDLLISKFGGKAVAAPKDTLGGRLPLHVAASAGSVECARLILSSVGPELAGLETPDYSGRTPLLCAAITGQCNVIGNTIAPLINKVSFIITIIAGASILM